MTDMFEMFSNLRERADTAGGVLSGGEQQMLTMCRTLMGDPDLVMIDEPTEGLAPKLVGQKLTIALKISKRVFVMGHGQVVFEGTPDALRANEQIRREWLEV